MSELDAILARLTALETVTRQLMTHLAVRADDPPRWVATRKTLALAALDAHPDPTVDRVRDAIDGFFDHLETVAAAYAQTGVDGTSNNRGR
ncbi:MAG: hypothetical protein BGO51_21080 [Rhodospirillales bacterium 69-11]|nr:hypothetical protein [Rhodospirillales bacterium]MBN8928768.1 hypothetical protein [Rhodospirillales bacterium]OJW27403.1 MAG: hypothetical protein BGO51_21080 [Rhodospirillales bacterium 69-11]